MQVMLRTVLAFVLVASFISVPFAGVAEARVKDFLESPSSDELREKYEDDTIRILVAPGHEPMYGGAQYQGVYEREIVVEVADELEELLENNPKFEVITTRNNEEWNNTLERYFDKEDDDIEDFVEDHKELADRLERRGNFDRRSEGDQVAHAAAPNDVALRLYGINKWANDNDIDLILNLHVNDAPDHGPNEPSNYYGYTVYIPDSEYGNHEPSEELAEALEERLEDLSPVSTLPGESAGVVEDQELIAIGAYGTLAVPSVLIEYGYITEPRFSLPVFRQAITRDIAYQTYLGVQDFFEDPVSDPRKITKLPYVWPKPTLLAGSTTTAPTVPTTIATSATTTAGTVAGASTTTQACAPFTETLSYDSELDPSIKSDNVRRLQQMLAKDPATYPEGLVTGYFGPATERAVQRFQEKHGIVSSGTPETTGYGAVGPRTAAALIQNCTSA